MSNVDMISDMLTRIKNASLVRSRKVLILKNNLILNILNLLKQEGFIESFEEIKPTNLTKEQLSKKYVLVLLKYKGVKQEPYITNLKRISKPGLRIYSSYKNIKKVLGGIGIAVLSTPIGVVTDRVAKSKSVGGEILFHIW
jgi:small subunit ribosomal protein S8